MQTDALNERYSRESIIHMSQEEYRALDVAEFARANLRRYFEHPGVLDKVYAGAYPELLRKHLSHLDLVGEDRAKVLFTVLHAVCSLVVPQAMTEEMQRAH